MIPRPDDDSPLPRALRVLVVENHPDSAAVLTRHLGLCGHESRTAPDGPAALEASREQSPDVVLLALDLPGGMDGWQVARRLQEQPAQKKPLLITVSEAESEDTNQSREAGIDLHLPRPVDLAALQKLLGRFHRIIS